MFEVIKTEGTARRGRFRCAHGGEVQTPVFMNVGTQGAIKGGIDAFDLKELGCQIELSNTYHLHLRPGDDVVRQMGGLHRFMRWDGPILTDSGGFQVFSLAGLRKITEEGVTFASHLDGHRIFMGPEESMQIQSHLGSDIAMAFDECVENPAQYDYAKASCERTLRWLERCKAEHDRLNALPDTVNPHQMLFGINQGATYRDLRIWHMQQIAKLNRGSCQLLLDDGANRLPQAFVCGCLAVIGIDRRNDQRAVGQAALCMKLTQQRSGLRAGWIARCRRASGDSEPGC